jgi:predicted phage-related endonuclease
MDINATMKELAEYIRLSEEIAATVEGLKDTLKAYMQEHNTEVLHGNEHKASYKAGTSERIDTTALKKQAPGIAAQYTKTTSSRRFLFN